MPCSTAGISGHGVKAFKVRPLPASIMDQDFREGAGHSSESRGVAYLSGLPPAGPLFSLSAE